MKEFKVRPYFLHVYINPKDGVAQNTITKELNKALDWFRFDNRSWIIYTSSNIDKWMLRLKKYVEPDGSLFLCKFDINERNGWMNKEFWNWIKKNNNK